DMKFKLEPSSAAQPGAVEVVYSHPLRAKPGDLALVHGLCAIQVNSEVGNFQQGVSDAHDLVVAKCVYQEQTLLQSRSHRSMHPALHTVLHSLFQWIEDHRRQVCLLRGTHRFRGSRKRILLCSGGQRKTILCKWKALRTAFRTEIQAMRLAVVLNSLLCGE
ncbi:MAG: hypothetical protein ACKPKO_64620, partial [Candidatus Fonsibacter sp.]